MAPPLLDHVLAVGVGRHRVIRHAVWPQRVRLVGAAVAALRADGFDEALVVLRVAEHPHRHPLAQRHVDDALEVAQVLATGLHVHMAAPSAQFRPPRHELHRAADVAATVEGALRPLQHLQAFHVAELGGRIDEDLGAIDVEPHALGVAERADAADGDVRVAIRPRRQVEVAHAQADVVDVGDAALLQVEPGNRGHGLRDLLQRFIPLARRDDDLLHHGAAFPRRGVFGDRDARRQADQSGQGSDEPIPRQVFIK